MELKNCQDDIVNHTNGTLLLPAEQEEHDESSLNEWNRSLIMEDQVGQAHVNKMQPYAKGDEAPCAPTIVAKRRFVCDN